MRKLFILLGMLVGVANINKAATWDYSINNYSYGLSDFSSSGAPATWSEGDLTWHISYDWNDPSNQYVELTDEGLQLGQDYPNYGDGGVSRITLTSNYLQGTVSYVNVGLEDCGGTVYVECSVGGTTYYKPGTGLFYGTPGDAYFGGASNGEICITITATDNAVVKLKYLSINYDTAEDVQPLDYPTVMFSDGQLLGPEEYITVARGTNMTIDGGNAKTIQVYKDGAMIWEGSYYGGGNNYSCELDMSAQYKVVSTNGFDTYERSFYVTVNSISEYIGFQVTCQDLSNDIYMGMVPNYYNNDMEPLQLPLGAVIQFYTMGNTGVSLWSMSGRSEWFSDGMGSITLDTPGYDEITLEVNIPTVMPDPDQPVENIFLIKVNVLPNEPGDITTNGYDPIDGATITLNIGECMTFFSEYAERIAIYRCKEGLDYMMQENYLDYLSFTFGRMLPMTRYAVEAWRGEYMKRVEFDLEVIDPDAEPEEPEFNFDDDASSRLAFKAGSGQLHVIWRLYDADGNEIDNNLASSGYRKAKVEDEDELWLNPVEVDDDGYFYISKPTEPGHHLSVKAKTVLNGKHSAVLSYEVDSNGGVTGIDGIALDNDMQPAYYDLRGVRLNGIPTLPGIYLRRTPTRIDKILIK